MAREHAATALERMSRLVEQSERAPVGGAPGPWRRVATAATAALLALALLAAAFVAYGTVVDNRWYKIVAIEGASMEPALSAGDAIVITRSPERLEPGMIVVLEVEGRLVTHRVVTVRRDGTFATRGDANEYVDDWSGLDVRVAGVVRGHVPLLGRALGSVGAGGWLNERADVPVTATT